MTDVMKEDKLEEMQKSARSLQVVAISFGGMEKDLKDQSHVKTIVKQIYQTELRMQDV